MGGTTGLEGRGCTDGGASLGMVVVIQAVVSFTGVGAVVFMVVIVVFVGCFCAISSTTFAFLGLVDFLVARTFLLGAIWTVDGNRKDEEEQASTSKNKRARARNRKREERKTGSSK